MHGRVGLLLAIGALVLGCSLETAGVGGVSAPDGGDADTDVDTDTDTDTDSDLDAGPSDGGPVGNRDGDRLPDQNDPCVDEPNALVTDGTADWMGVQGTWEFVDGSAAGTGDGAGAFAWSGPCPGAVCVADYFVDVVVSIEDPLPDAFGVLGSMEWPDLADYYCELVPGEPWEMVLEDEPGGGTGESADLADPPNRFAFRLMVRGGRQSCRGHRLDDPIVRARLPARPAGAVGLYVFGGTIVFESVHVYDLPDDCVPVPTNPPAP